MAAGSGARGQEPPAVSYGVNLSFLRPDQFVDVAVLSEQLGFESVWISEHVVLPAGSSHDEDDSLSGSHPGFNEDMPLFDPLVVLAGISRTTEQLRLGTYIYLLALRHPLVAARSITTLDWMSGGRVELGVGAGWLREEYEALGLRPGDRGGRLEESIRTIRRLWSEDTISVSGARFDFGPVSFEPKPPQGRALPIHVGGESEVGLERAAALGAGWIGTQHSPASARAVTRTVRSYCGDLGRDAVEITVMADRPMAYSSREWSEAGVDRVIVAPWDHPDGVGEALRRFAERSIPAREPEG